MFDNVKVTYVKRVTPSRECKTYDIEVDSELHAFMAKSPDGEGQGVSHNSALISLSNLSDDRMRNAKTGAWWETEPQRALANNSAVYTEKPSIEIFMEEWLSLIKSKSGERGIFSRVASQKQAAKWGRRKPDASYGTNPCCFVGNTLIQTTNGVRSIENIVNDVSVGIDVFVPTRNIATGAVEVKQVVAGKLTKESAKVVTLDILNSRGNTVKITCTPDHLFFTENRGWVQAIQLTSDDIIAEQN